VGDVNPEFRTHPVESVIVCSEIVAEADKGGSLTEEVPSNVLVYVFTPSVSCTWKGATPPSEVYRITAESALHAIAPAIPPCGRGSISTFEERLGVDEQPLASVMLRRSKVVVPGAVSGYFH